MMDKRMIIDLLSAIHQSLLENEDYAECIEKLNAMKINSLVNYYINIHEDFDEDDKLIVELIIRILQNIYNNSGEISPVTDEDYDKLYEINRNISDDEIVGSSFNASDKITSRHKYPDLRGTLDKVHFMTVKEKGKDKRKSLEEWIKSCDRILNDKGIDISVANLHVDIFPKWDGLSVIHECDEKGEVNKSLTRGDTEKNEAVELTKMFKGTNFETGNIETPKTEFGVKTEVIMSEDNYKELCQKEGYFKSPRSAVSSILNSKELDRKYLKYLTVIPLQVQRYDNKKIMIADESYSLYPWSTGRLDDLDSIMKKIDAIRDRIYEDYKYPIDGAVLRITDERIQRELGRENNINNYDVAYKFPPEQKKTVIKSVIFNVGLLGAIAPVAIIEPVKIKGNTISNISLGSIDRFESLDLREGDEVIVKYDVIPYLAKDDACRPGKGYRFETPKTCPICNQQLYKQPVLKCINTECESRIIGKIQNYIEKMRIANISIGIVTDLFQEGFLKSIQDLYKLADKKREIALLHGYGEKSVSKILDGINSRRTVYDYEMLGAIGIPDIAEKIFKKILNIYYLDEFIDICLKNQTNKLISISGIKEKTADKIIEGINFNWKLLKFLRSELDVRRDERRYTIKVCFTKVRDEDFEKYLDSKNVAVLESFNKEVDILIIPHKGVESSKIDKALKNDKKKTEIVTIDEAYKMFGYH